MERERGREGGERGRERGGERGRGREGGKDGEGRRGKREGRKNRDSIDLYMTLIIHEMLRKTRQQKLRQSNTTLLIQSGHFSKKNWLPQVGLKPMTVSF